MTTTYITTSSATTVTTDSGDTLYEVSGVYIEQGISMTGAGGGNETIDIYGGVLGTIYDYNNQTAGGDKILIGATGYVDYSLPTDDGGAIALSGGGNSVVNAGTINATNYGRAISIIDVSSDGMTAIGTNLSSDDSIANTGTISGALIDGNVSNYGVITVFSILSGATLQNSGSILASGDELGILIEAYGSVAVTNSGSITGGAFIAGSAVDIINSGTISGLVECAGSETSVINTGVIAGDVKFDNNQSSDTHTFDGSFGHVTGTVFAATGANVFTGGAGADKFDLTNGTTSTVDAAAGDDIIHTYLDAGIMIDGGTGNDIVTVAGSSAGFIFDPATMVNVEHLQLTDGFSYNLTTDNATVATGATLAIDASTLTGTNKLAFDGSAETDGRFVVTGGAGNDSIETGAGNDSIDGGAGSDAINSGSGVDKIQGGSGNDTISYTSGALTAVDKIDGGAGTDTVILSSDMTGTNALLMTATTMINVEVLKFAANNSFDVTTSNATIASGATLTVNASALTVNDTLTFNGSAETNGHFKIQGGAGGDILTGGSQSDTFIYTSAAQSTSVHYDTINAFNFSNDKFNVTGTISKIETAVNHSISTASFDTDIQAAVAGGHLVARSAILITANAGSLNGDVFLVVDQNGSAGYQAGHDLVIEMHGATGTIGSADFI